jgi:uncharacterized protein (UPF0264 family)
VTEAEAALAGGAGLIDVKEPAHGSLGRAADATIAAVVHHVAGRRPVSAALGELRESGAPSVTAGLAFVKWGLAGCGSWPCWRQELADAARRVAQVDPACRVVPVAYADWRRAAAPPPQAVVAFVREFGCAALLIDTFQKDGTTLLDWLSVADVARLCQAAGVPVALAGSLGPEEIERLRGIELEWFAVRGAVCGGGRRAAAVDAGQVRRLVELVAGPLRVARSSGSRPAPTR